MRSSSARLSPPCSPVSTRRRGYAVHTNLIGAYNCLELARRESAQLVFLSTSRVYPVAPLTKLALPRTGDPLRARRGAGSARRERRGHLGSVPARGRPHALRRDEACRGAARRGVRRDLRAARRHRPLWRDRRARGRWERSIRASSPTGSPRTCSAGRLRYLGISRDGEAGPRRAPRRRSRRSRRRAGGRTARLVRSAQRRRGPRARPVSLRDDRAVPRDHRCDGRGRAEGRRASGDIPIYVSDCSRLHAASEWRPRRTPVDVLLDIHAWLTDHRADLKSVLA